MWEIKVGATFKSDYRRMKERQSNLNALAMVIDLLATGKPLPRIYNDRTLVSHYIGCRECLVEPDWLLVYEIKRDELLVCLTRTGTHSDIFS